jgi:hypothetical protein
MVQVSSEVNRRLNNHCLNSRPRTTNLAKIRMVYPTATFFNSPFVIQLGAENIPRCKSLSERQGMRRSCAARPRYLAVVTRMALAAEQRWIEAEDASSTEQETRDNPHQDMTADEAATSNSPAPAPASDDATPAAASSTNCFQ